MNDDAVVKVIEAGGKGDDGVGGADRDVDGGGVATLDGIEPGGFFGGGAEVLFQIIAFGGDGIDGENLVHEVFAGGGEPDRKVVAVGLPFGGDGLAKRAENSAIIATVTVNNGIFAVRVEAGAIIHVDPASVVVATVEGVVEVIVVVGGLDDGVVDIVVTHVDEGDGVGVAGFQFVEVDLIEGQTDEIPVVAFFVIWGIDQLSLGGNFAAVGIVSGFLLLLLGMKIIEMPLDNFKASERENSDKDGSKEEREVVEILFRFFGLASCGFLCRVRKSAGWVSRGMVSASSVILFLCHKNPQIISYIISRSD